LRWRISRRHLRRGRDIASIIPTVPFVRIKKKIERQEQRLRVTRKEQTEKKDRHQDRRQKLPDWQIESPFQKTIDRQTHNAADAIVNRPDGYQVIAGLAFIRVSAAGTSVERGKPVTQGTYSSHGHKDVADAASRTSQPHGPMEVMPDRGRGARLFHILRIRRQICHAKAGLFVLSGVKADDNTDEFSRYAKYHLGWGSMGR
jgi:hypothetical protein